LLQETYATYTEKPSRPQSTPWLRVAEMRSSRC